MSMKHHYELLAAYNQLMTSKGYQPSSSTSLREVASLPNPA